MTKPIKASVQSAPATLVKLTREEMEQVVGGVGAGCGCPGSTTPGAHGSRTK